MIHARTLGECSLDLDSTHVGPEAEAVFGLLIYLVMERGSRIPRPMLVELMWNELPDDKGRHCLRQTIYKCRQIGVRLESTPDYVMLRADDVVADFASWLSPETLDMEQLRGGGSVGEFLPGYAPAISNAYTDWLERQRDYVHAQIRRTLTQAIAAHRAQGRWSDVEVLARQCLRFDSLNEEATLALAEATAMSGSKAKALGIIDRYVTELGNTGGDIRLPASLLRRRIAERLPHALYAAPSERCFVGRETSMAVLSGLFESVRLAQGRSVFIWGEPGVGKSRLCQEFAKAAVLHGARVARVGCQQSDVRRPLSAFVDIVPGLQSLPGGLGCSPTSVGYLKRLTSHDPNSTTPSAEASEAEFLFGNVRRAILDLFDAVASECTLLVHIEDVHWLDPMSWDVLRELMEWAESAKVMILLTSRTAYATASSAAEMPVKLVRHRLTPLDGASAATLMDAMVAERKRPMDESYRAWCVNVAEGNPLYLRELASQWLERGEVQEMPASLAGLIEARLARLQAKALRVLQVCAVLGKNSTFERLEGATGFRRHEMLEAVEELEALGLLASDASGVSPKHDLLAAAVLRRSSGAARRLVHRHVASALEREVLETHSAELMWECAEHWRTSGDATRATRLTRICAAHALEVGLPSRAIEIFEREQQRSQSSEEFLELARGLTDAYHIAGQWASIAALLPEFRSRKRLHVSPSSEHDDDELTLAHAEERLGRPLDPLVAQMLRCASSRDAPHAHRTGASIMAFRMAYNAANRTLASIAYQVALELCGDEPENRLARATIEMMYHSSYGDLTVAADAARTVIETQRLGGSPLYLARALQHASVPLLQLGRFAEADAYAQEGLEIASRFEMFSLAVHCADHLAMTALEAGDFERAETLYLDAARRDGYSQDYAISGSVMCTGARAALGRGDLATAQTRFTITSYESLPNLMPRARTEIEGVFHLLRMARNEPLAIEFTDYLQLVRANMSIGNQDFPVAATVRCLAAAGRTDERDALLAEYATQRREAYPLPSEYASRIAPCQVSSGASGENPTSDRRNLLVD